MRSRVRLNNAEFFLIYHNTGRCDDDDDSGDVDVDGKCVYFFQREERTFFKELADSKRNKLSKFAEK